MKAPGDPFLLQEKHVKNTDVKLIRRNPNVRAGTDRYFSRPDIRDSV